jgi:hypothetical protein
VNYKNAIPSHISNIQISSKNDFISIKHASILSFTPLLRFHDIVVVHDNGGMITIDYTPINQCRPDILLKLLIGKYVTAEVRIRKMTAWNLTEWYSLPSIGVSDIIDVVLRNKIIRVIDGWNHKDIDRGLLKMNLYKRNCKHFSNFVIKNF